LDGFPIIIEIVLFYHEKEKKWTDFRPHGLGDRRDDNRGKIIDGQMPGKVRVPPQMCRL
jgi:hypothetical protein